MGKLFNGDQVFGRHRPAHHQVYNSDTLGGCDCFRIQFACMVIVAALILTLQRVYGFLRWLSSRLFKKFSSTQISATYSACCSSVLVGAYKKWSKQIKPKGCSHLHTAFTDFKQAYDTIDRPHLWDHLNNIIDMDAHSPCQCYQTNVRWRRVCFDWWCQNYQYR